MRKNFLLLLLAAMFTMVSCEQANTSSFGEEEQVSNEGKNENDEGKNDEGKNGDVIDNGEDREIDPFLLSLQGTWYTYTMIHYDEEWKEVIKVLMENGSSDLDGMSSDHYTFNADGTLTLSYLDLPNGWKDLWTLPCFYDEASKIISVKRNNGKTHCEYLVSDYDGEYLTLDYTEHLYDSYTDEHTYRYVRETLKRRQE